MTNNNYELDILINGKPAKEYIKDGKIYIEGRKGTDFSLKIRNNSNKRILAIPSVDGLSVMNGKTASFDSSGYIIDARDSITIDGWRTSDKEVARFYFSNQGDSYASKMDKEGNIGVIGMAVFEEKFDELEALKKAIEEFKDKQPIEKHIHHYDHHHHCHNWWCGTCNGYTLTYTSTTGGSAGTTGSSAGDNSFYSSDNLATASASASVFNTSSTPTINNSVNTVQLRSMTKSLKQELGTGWGESKRSEVRTVEFERADSPTAVFEIFYNTREQLELMGVDFNAKPVYVAPQAFPGIYCEPPRK